LLSVGFIFFNGVSGTGKTQISLMIEIGILSIYLVYVYQMVYRFGADVSMVWTAEWIYGSLLSLLSYIYLRTGKWRKSRI